MKILKPILYCLLGAMLAIVAMYFMNNKKEKQEVIIDNDTPSVELEVSSNDISLELDDDQLKIYNDIITLMNGIEYLSIENINLKDLLDRLSKNLNNREKVITLVLQINEQLYNGGILIDIKQKELLDSILLRLEDVIPVQMSDYEKNKQEILSLLPTQGYTIKSTIEEMFENYENNYCSYLKPKRAESLRKIWNTIIEYGIENKGIFNEEDFTPYFCEIFDYYDILNYTYKCETAIN